jgi:hypothetical protein
MINKLSTSKRCNRIHPGENSQALRQYELELFWIETGGLNIYMQLSPTTASMLLKSRRKHQSGSTNHQRVARGMGGDKVEVNPYVDKEHIRTHPVPFSALLPLPVVNL